MQRRDLLAGLGGLAGAAGLGGCLGGPAGDPTTTPSDRPTATATPTPIGSVMAAIEVLERPCGEGEGAAMVSFTDDGVRVEGTIGGRDTCDTAELTAVRLDAGVLELVVGVVKEDPDATVDCAQCLTDIAYVATVTVGGGRPDRVEVVHDAADGRRTVATADRT